MRAKRVDTARQRRQTARKMWEHLILLFCEMAHVPRKLHDTNWREHIHFSGDSRRQFVRLLLDPRPVTIVSGHFGNFEIGNYVLGMLGFPSFAIARPLDNPYLERFVKRFRRATGQQILPTHGSAQQIASILKDGHTLAMLGDQHAGWKGCFVEQIMAGYPMCTQIAMSGTDNHTVETLSLDWSAGKLVQN